MSNRFNFNKDDIINKQFSNLTVLSYSHSTDKTPIKHFYNCKCICGNEKVILRSNLISQHIKSCGCLRKIKGKTNKGWLGYEDLSMSQWTSYKIKAKLRNLLFEIDIKYAWDLFILQNKLCALTNIPLIIASKNTKTTKNRVETTASLDRIDNTKGYIKDNVQWVHKDINWMKGTFEQQYFISLCKLVSNKN